MSLYGYDTAVLAWHQSDPAGFSWDDVITHQEGGRKAYLNLPTVQFTRLQDPKTEVDEFRVQASLPRLLRASNAVAVGESEVAAALDVLDEQVHEVFRDAPPVREMAVRRLDTTSDRLLQGLDDVRAVLASVGGLPIRGRLPVVGEDRSATWSAGRGGVKKRVYSKFLESGEQGTEGYLRVECQANGKRAIMRRLDPTEFDGRGTLTPDIVFSSPRFAERVTGPLVRVVDAAIEGVSQLTYWQAYQAFRAAGYRSDRCQQLLGIAMVLRAVGGDWRGVGLSTNKARDARNAFAKAGVDPSAITWENGPSAGDLANGHPDARVRYRLNIMEAIGELEREESADEDGRGGE